MLPVQGQPSGAVRNEVYFVSDVHLGLRFRDPSEREARFVAFLKALPVARMQALYLLGDIWDFWYEYRDVIPREGSRVTACIMDIMDAGVEVWFCPGNHDIWTFSYFESIGMHRFDQPGFFSIGGRSFCLGHGDLLGGAPRSYSLMIRLFRSRIAQRLFSLLHPWIAFRIGNGWSNSNRRRHEPYRFKGESEPLYRFAAGVLAGRKVDYFVFGHLHDAVDMELPGGARLVVLKDWMDGGWNYARFDGITFSLCSGENPPE